MKALENGYRLTAVGVVFDRALTDAEYESLGKRLAAHATATMWAIGDWLVAGTGRGPEGNAYGLAHQLTGRSYESLSQYSRVSASYAHDERGRVPWSLYREALRLPTAERLRTLALAQQNNWNRTGLIDFINSRLDQKNSTNADGAHESGALTKRRGGHHWRQEQSAPKRDVTCPHCGFSFDVRRKGLTETAIEPVGAEHKESLTA